MTVHKLCETERYSVKVSPVVPGVQSEEDVVLTDVEPDPQLRPELAVLGEDESVGREGEANVVALTKVTELLA